jgi:hypothetical protein
MVIAVAAPTPARWWLSPDFTTTDQKPERFRRV